MPTGALPDLSLCQSLPTQAIHSWGAGPLDLLKVVLLNHHQAGPVFSACPDVYPASFMKPVPLRSPSSWIPVVSVVSFLHIWWALHQKCTFHICVLTSLDLRTQGVLLNH